MNEISSLKALDSTDPAIYSKVQRTILEKQRLVAEQTGVILPSLDDDSIKPLLPLPFEKIDAILGITEHDDDLGRIANGYPIDYVETDVEMALLTEQYEEAIDYLTEQ